MAITNLMAVAQGKVNVTEVRLPAIFQVVSAMSTTGFSTVGHENWCGLG